MSAILCVGALALDTIFLLEELPKGPGKFLPRETLEVAQGMATAQAATIVRLGGSARLWASHGDDEIGRRIVDQLVEAGIDISALRKVPGARSGFSSILMDPTGERIIVPHYDAALRSRAGHRTADGRHRAGQRRCALARSGAGRAWRSA